MATAVSDRAQRDPQRHPDAVRAYDQRRSTPSYVRVVEQQHPRQRRGRRSLPLARRLHGLRQHDERHGQLCHRCRVATTAIITNNVVDGGVVGGYGDDLFVVGQPDIWAWAAELPPHWVARRRQQHRGHRQHPERHALGYGIQVDVGPSGGSVTIARNTFTRHRQPHLLRLVPGHRLPWPRPSAAAPATRTRSSTRGAAWATPTTCYELDGPTLDVNAEYNNWGLCTADEIEQEIYHQVDDPALGARGLRPVHRARQLLGHADADPHGHAHAHADTTATPPPRPRPAHADGHHPTRELGQLRLDRR